MKDEKVVNLLAAKWRKGVELSDRIPQDRVWEAAVNAVLGGFTTIEGIMNSATNGTVFPFQTLDLMLRAVLEVALETRNGTRKEDVLLILSEIDDLGERIALFPEEQEALAKCREEFNAKVDGRTA